MKHLLLFILISLFQLMLSTNSFAQGTNLDWFDVKSGLSHDRAYRLVVDDDGNTYTVGRFTGVVDFDPGPGIHTIDGSSVSDTYVQKLDKYGNLVWVKNLAGIATATIEGLDIAVDSIHNVYLCGNYDGTVDFDPGPGALNMTGDHDIFVVKLTPQGDLAWAKTMGNIWNDNCNSICVDNNGGVYVTGDFNGSIDIDPGPNVHTLLPIVNSGYYTDAFVLKLNSVGDYEWAFNIGNRNYERSYGSSIGPNGNLYVIGNFYGIMDFDPTVGVLNLSSGTGEGMYIQKITPNGSIIWTKIIEAVSGNFDPQNIHVDDNSDVYITGGFSGSKDFDPGSGVFTINTTSIQEPFVLKLDGNGDFVWAKSMPGPGLGLGYDIVSDNGANVYITGTFNDTLDFDPGLAQYQLISNGSSDVYVQKLDNNGDFIWAGAFGNLRWDEGRGIAVDKESNIYISGWLSETVDLDIGSDSFLFTPEPFYSASFTIKMKQRGITGNSYLDLNQNCNREPIEIGLGGRRFLINPGGLIVETNESGIWTMDSLPIGSYTITADTSSFLWQISCPITQSFNVTNPDSIIKAPSFGFVSMTPCSTPDISIHAPILRPGFSNQKVYVRACNTYQSTETVYNPIITIKLDTLLTVQGASHFYIPLAHNTFQVTLDSLHPGYCQDIWLDCHLSTNAILNQTVCIKASFAPVDSCSLDSLMTHYFSGSTGFPGGTMGSVGPCTGFWDRSNLTITGTCLNDSIQFVIYNTGIPIGGNMDCYSPVRLFIDGQYVMLDSVQIAGQDSIVYRFPNDGRTWRMEVDQHPLHRGNSHPNATVELCGDINNWTSDLVNILPHNDLDPIVDIFCGLVQGSYDPNDKIGYPLGVNATHDILPNQELEYRIRFQNTGTDTAFTVVIRDTLSQYLNPFTAHSGSSSHSYNVRIYGPQILEWTFNDILLPDSSTNLSASQGFVTFKVAPITNLPIGTVIENEAAIYFDYNSPIITNTTEHRIDTPKPLILSNIDTVTIMDCDTFQYDGFVYNTSGTYWLPNYLGLLDSLTILNFTSQTSYTYEAETSCDSFLWNGTTYFISGVYEYIHPTNNMYGCDSISIIDLCISNVPNINISQNGSLLTADTNGVGISYQWVDCNNNFSPIAGANSQSFNALMPGTYAVEITSNCCSGISSCYNVVGLETHSTRGQNKIFVYPNPTSKILNIEMSVAEEVNVLLIDNLGRTLIKKTFWNKRSQLNLSKIPLGVYHLSVLIKGKIESFKIIKQ